VREDGVTLPVPAIDLDDTTPTQLVDHLRRHSCLVIVAGHGIADDLWWSLVEQSKAFFDLPEATKEPARWNRDGPWRGWMPVGSTDAYGATTKLLEKYEVSLPHPWTGDALDVDARAAAFDLWPTQPDGFVPAWVHAYDAMGALAERVVGMIIDALALPDELRPAWTTHHYANLVVNNYMALAEPPVKGQSRHPGHVDIGGITLLSAEEAPGGLEIDAGGTWVSCVLPPNAYLVQAGDLLRRWTNNRIPGNLHRVVNPPPELAAAARRTSVAYFHYPALDTEVVPAPSCLDGTEAERGALRSLDHMIERQRKRLVDGAYDDEYA
jgi:isopenicillin N synthase-like dioxygenase